MDVVLGWLLIMRHIFGFVARRLGSPSSLVGAVVALRVLRALLARMQLTRLLVLHAARLLDVAAGKVVSPGEVLVEGNKIVEVGAAVTHPAGAEVIDLGDATLMPGLIDAHVHLFLHPGAEDLQTVQESVPQRTILAELRRAMT